MKMNKKEELLKFIAEAHQNTYAASDEIRAKNKCEKSILAGHIDYSYKNGDFKYYDSYAGSQWAPGKEIVFFQDEPIWCMSYQGQDNEKYDSVFYQEKVFPFLKQAMLNFDPEKPFRGPEEFTAGDFKYTFEMKGDYDYFVGQENIFYKGEKVFFKMLWEV